jgi:hypothetical protein
MSSGAPSRVATPLSNPFGLFVIAEESDDAGDISKSGGSRRARALRDDLPFRIELWNEGRTAVERILATTVNSSIGYAAYHAATREHPDRYVTLRHRNRFLARWNAPE